MATKAMHRVSVTFPADLLEELDRFVPQRGRNQFIVEATERSLRQRRLSKVLTQLRQEPAWSDENHPDLTTIEDVDRYVRRLREAWMPRSWDEMLEEARCSG